MKLTKEILDQLKAAKNVEELVSLAKEQGIDLTQEAAKDLYEKLSKATELTDEMLDEVAGGLNSAFGSQEYHGGRPDSEINF